MDARWFRKYSDIVKEAEQVTQEAEQLDELSPELLDRAADKAMNRAIDYKAMSQRRDPDFGDDSIGAGELRDPASKLSDLYRAKNSKFRAAAGAKIAQQKQDQEKQRQQAKLDALRNVPNPASSAALRKISSTNKSIDAPSKPLSGRNPDL